MNPGRNKRRGSLEELAGVAGEVGAGEVGEVSGNREAKE
jgi:hypothetical protein